MTDIDERRNAIIVGVATQAQVPVVEQLLRALPVPSSAIIVQQQDAQQPQSGGHLSPLAKSTSLIPSQSLLDFLRPVPAGAKATWTVSYGTGYITSSCTIGFNLTGFLGDSALPARYFLTNSHCTGRESQMGVVVPAFYTQPIDPFFLGLEWVDPPFFAGEPDCPTGRLCRSSESALIKYDSSHVAHQGHIAIPPVGGSKNFTQMAAVTGVVMPFLGYAIHMVGKTSGHRTGVITRTCADFIFVYAGSPEPSRNLWFLCQGEANQLQGEGDSGAPIFELLGDGSQAWAVGVNWGSQGAFSPMYAVLNELFVTAPANGILDPTTSPPPAGPSTSIAGKSVVKPNAPCIWTASISGGVPPFSSVWFKNGAVIAQDVLTVTTSFAANGVLQFQAVDLYGRGSTSSRNVSVSANAQVCQY